MLQSLSPREEEVIELAADGLANKEIARDLGVSESAVKRHMESIFSKYDAKNRAEAVAIWLRQRAG